jgi:peptide/nickel transport system substrate-binding protein
MSGGAEKAVRWFVRALSAALVVAVAVQPNALGSTRAAPDGGVFRISLAPQSGLDSMDPALSFTAPGWALLDTTCARLMSYPDAAPPAGLGVQPEVAAGPPKVSSDLKTYTFTLRPGFRFSNGAPVRASAFARAINRALSSTMRSPGARFMLDIDGAAAVRAGRSATASGVVARGNTLTVRFTNPTPDFAARTTLPFFCAVPPTLPDDPEGIGAIPSAGPYTVVEYRPGERVVIRRNPFYGGSRPHHVDGFNVDLRAASPQDMLQRIERGEADWGHTLAPVFLDPALDLVAKYGVNHSRRLFAKPGLTMRMFAFNSSRPLFRNNPRLRRAVNFALDRRALQAVAGGPLAGSLTDQYLPASVPGYRDADVYPLDHADVPRAKELARDNLRGGKAVMVVSDFQQPLAVAQLAKRQLAEIGLDLTIKAVPPHIATAAYLDTLTEPGAEWDLALVLYTPNLPDPHAYINLLLDTHFIGGTNLARFESRRYDEAMRRASRLPQARERYRAYAELDARLAREAAPLVALSTLTEWTLVSKRVGCMVLRPVLDLTAVCLK